MRSPTFFRLFIGLTLVVLLSDLAFLATNYVAGRDALARAMQQEGEKLRSGFAVAMTMTYANMLQLARFVSTDPRVQRTFHEGKRAVEAEGGGPGGEGAAVARQALLELVRERWEQMQAEFGVRQLHFHLAPGSLSFLRVHAAGKFGDRMDDVRHIIVDTNNDGKARTGLETGRIYTGLRGVVPVVALPEDGGGHFGAVEVGSSFQPIVSALDRQLGAGIAVLLRHEHVDSNMWQEYVDKYFPGEPGACDCFVEATSRDDIYAILRDPVFGSIRGKAATDAVSLGERVYAVTRFPLFDYTAEAHPGTPPVGSVVLWTDDTEAVNAFRRSQWVNLGLGVFGFLLVELLLWGGMRLVARRMASELAIRTAELEEQTARLEKSNGELDRFASVISHDLQAPNRAVVSYLGLLEEKLAGTLDDEGKEFLGFAVEGGRRMAAMIRDLLAYSRVGRDPAPPEPVALDDVLASVRLDLALAIEEAGATLEVGPMPTVMGRAGDLTRVFDNLIANAVKYRSPERAPLVRVWAERDGERWCIAVEDNGIGVPMEYRARIFDFFQRAGQKPGIDGTGIGLAVVKKVVEMHGGSIWMDTAPSGAGSVFRFTLPAADRSASP
ncbi:ATP-binding protein [Magnetospirillum sp. UT-4]|uniref:sensor histidine kinase n=1 Tax=Magnetospirillum sp. UT-4 TaxID=2681467 RepID=UPI001572494F|nr:ATP-binding protein [Magnetospirillum sp. UT-4]